MVSSWIWLSLSVLYLSTDTFRVKSSVWSSVSTLIFRVARRSCDFSDTSQERISFKIVRSDSCSCELSTLNSQLSTPCLYCVVNVQIARENVFQELCSKANSGKLDPLETGGSWKKSPTRTTCIPPNGSGETRDLWRSRSSEARNAHESIDISSMIRTDVFAKRFMRYSRPMIYSRSSLVRLSRIPIPLHECIVIPPIWVAAIPVEAVIATPIPCSWQYRINRLTRNVFPLPAAPVRNTLYPIESMSKASSWIMRMSVWKKGWKTIKNPSFEGFFIILCFLWLNSLSLRVFSWD